MTQHHLKFAICNNKLVHASDVSGDELVCIGCGQPLIADTDNKSFKHDGVDCGLSNHDVLVKIAKKQIASYKELCIPTQFVNNAFKHELTFESVLLNQEVSGQFVDVVATSGETQILIMFPKDKTSLNLDEYILEIRLPQDGWDFDNYTDTIQRLSDLVLGDSELSCKKWTHMPYPVLQAYGSFNSVKNGLNLDALKVDEYVFNIEEISTLQGGSASESAQDWFWRKTSVWRQGMFCAWQGLSYANKCRKCEKFGDTRCSLTYPVLEGIDMSPAPTTVTTEVATQPVVPVEYKEDLDF